MYDNPVFTRANGNELWVLLLEKAYAKIYGNYEILEGGFSNVVFRELTGAPCIKMNTFKYEKVNGYEIEKENLVLLPLLFDCF